MLYENYKKKTKIVKNFFLNLFFPKFCLRCGKEGDYLCYDCCSLIEIAEEQFCPFCPHPKIVLDGKTCQYCRRDKKLAGLFCAASYENPLVKKLLRLLKYEPFVKDIAPCLANLIISHFSLLDKKPEADFIVPVPLHKKKLKERGFNQAMEIALGISLFLEKPLLENVLVKTKSTPAQMELTRKQRQENLKGVFQCLKPELVKDKKILLIDDILTTGSTLEECACVLKEAGAKQVWAAVVARG